MSSDTPSWWSDPLKGDPDLSVTLEGGCRNAKAAEQQRQWWMRLGSSVVLHPSYQCLMAAFVVGFRFAVPPQLQQAQQAKTDSAVAVSGMEASLGVAGDTQNRDAASGSQCLSAAYAACLSHFGCCYLDV